MTSPLSHVAGAAQPNLIDATISDAIVSAARQWPEQLAVISRHQNVRLTWLELKEAADSFARALLKLGLKQGDRVGVWAPNCVEWTIAQFATARAGLILVNINPAYRLVELEYTLRKVGVSALICANTFKTSNYVAMVEELVPELSDATANLPHSRLPALRHFIKIGGSDRPGWLNFDAVLKHGHQIEDLDLDLLAGQLLQNDPINIQFTSGTTGLPKGATLSHRNVINNAYFCGIAMGLKHGDKLCIPVPLYHCFGMVMGNLNCALHGATMVYPSEGFDPVAVLEAVQAERCTALHGVPTMFIAELEHPRFAEFDLSSLRMGIMAGTPCPTEVMNKVVERMHMRDVGVAYGMTETSPVSTQTALSDPLDLRVSTIGRVQPHLEIKIIDTETGETVPRGVSGELCTKGYSVMLGYWDESELTAQTVIDGWMHTGDLAVMDEDDYLRIAGRAKDMIIRGGENIYPRELEEFLFRHDMVEDVQIVGVPDTFFGEEVCACIRLRSGAVVSQEELREFCRGQIAHYKVPRHVQFVDEFPMTVTGKVQKHVLRDLMIDVLGLKP